MSDEIKKTTISEMAKLIGGYAFKSGDFTTAGVPVVKIKNIGDKYLSLNDVDYLPEKFMGLDKKFKIQYGDVMISLTGSHITQPNSAVGRVARSREKSVLLLNQRVGKMKVYSDKCNLDFLYHYMSSNTFREQIGLRARGAANQANISAKDVEGIEIPNFSLVHQQKIAAILSAYDDLIENNLQRIKLLEEMAQITYEEWFVRMKFPGHETTHWDKETGLPEGWTRATCFDVMDVLSGGTPKTDNADYWNGSINFYTPKDATNGIYTQPTEKKITTEGLKTCNSKLYPKDTLFITARGTVGKLNLAHEPMAMNQSCYALRAKEGLSQYYLYCSVYKAIDAFKGAANGGVFDAIVVDTFKFLPFVKPNTDVVNAFTANVESAFNAVFSLLKQNELLREAREILLPRLMTGVIDVDQVEVPEALLARVG